MTIRRAESSRVNVFAAEEHMNKFTDGQLNKQQHSEQLSLNIQCKRTFILNQNRNLYQKNSKKK